MAEELDVGWRERGDDEHHRKHLVESPQDRHMMRFIIERGGERAGYGEMSWVKEGLADLGGAASARRRRTLPGTHTP